ncbi:acyl-CoA dehydrogenase family protein [Ideonella sp.]|uniref:acyl-CoA dehydrogenase family protein n=1 Tax=Ideonella sp. TaxID=1929293 RepID=UPI002B4A133E|nr:acyl-CoA dehydrogenase family protein [Ideonella sp.]HJV68055.1 acyl-CoA dehydrogenase family protein [Ideonella sp.]
MTASTRATPHIAGDPALLSPRQRELVALAAELGRTRFAPRAAVHDRDATFPVENLRDLRDSGLLALCVPAQRGGLGADFTAAMLVVAEIGRHCGATALSFNMHASATLWAGPVADALDLTPAERADQEAHRAIHFERIVRHGKLYAQPFSEGGAASAGKAPWGTLAKKVEGGYLVNGRKLFATLAGVADYYGVLCTLDTPGASQRDALYLAVPADSPGVSVGGEWDPLGMRATVSRDLLLKDVFVRDNARLLPEGRYFEATQRCPYMFATLAATYMGIAQAAYDFTVQYLRAELPGMPPVQRRMYPTKQLAVAQMRIMLEQARALFLQTAQNAQPDPDAEARLRLLAGHYTVMESANALCALAIRTCGGASMLKSLPLERLYRDSRCGSLMLPWTAELCLDQLGRDGLYDPGEGDEVIE